MGDMIILESIVIKKPKSGGNPSFRLVVSYRRVFESCLKDRGAELVCATDGTYKLHFCDWTLVDCGS